MFVGCCQRTGIAAGGIFYNVQAPPCSNTNVNNSFIHVKGQKWIFEILKIAFQI